MMSMTKDKEHRVTGEKKHGANIWSNYQIYGINNLPITDTYKVWLLNYSQTFCKSNLKGPIKYY